MFSSLAILLFLAGAAAIAPAAGTNAGAPLTVDADHSTAINQADSDTRRITYGGHVVIARSDMVIHGDRAVVYTRHQRLEKAVVTGTPAQFSWQGPSAGRPVHGEADEVSYTVANHTVELQGEVTLHRGAETFSAATVRYALDSQVLTAEGGKNGRIHAVIPPAASVDGGAAQRP